MILQAVGEGFLTGLWLSMSFGPVFFILIQTSLEKGVRNALLFDLGVLISDLFYIIIAYLGASIVFENASFEKWVAVIGGVILIFFGIIPFFSKRKQNISQDEINQLTKAGATGLIFKGFFINFLNPAVLFIWLGAASIAVGRYEGKQIDVIAYFSAILITYFGNDLIKVYLSIKLKRFIKPSIMLAVNRISGLIIMIFGAYLVYNYLK